MILGKKSRHVFLLIEKRAVKKLLGHVFPQAEVAVGQLHAERAASINLSEKETPTIQFTRSFNNKTRR
ncbi:MAG: hypothetical protein AAGA21_07290 [Pseudomonadota bacterium]